MFDLIRSELDLCHVAFSHGSLREFCEVMHHLAFDPDCPQWWAETFLEAMRNEYDGLKVSSLN